MLFNADALVMLRHCIPDNSVDAIVTDPPYGLSFIGIERDPAYVAIARSRGVRG